MANKNFKQPSGNVYGTAGKQQSETRNNANELELQNTNNFEGGATFDTTMASCAHQEWFPLRHKKRQSKLFGMLETAFKTGVYVAVLENVE